MGCYKRKLLELVSVVFSFYLYSIGKSLVNMIRAFVFHEKSRSYIRYYSFLTRTAILIFIALNVIRVVPIAFSFIFHRDKNKITL